MIQSINIHYRDESDLDHIPSHILSHPRDKILVQVFSGILEEERIATLIGHLKKRLPGAHILGTTAAGEILEGQVLDHSVAINFTCFSKTTVRCALVTQNDDLVAAGNQIASSLRQSDVKAIIAFGCGIKDKRLPSSQVMLDTLHQHFPDATISGGQAGDDGKFERTRVFTASGVTDSGFAAVSLSGTELIARNDYSLSWIPIGKKLTINRAEGSRVYSIDGKPPYEIYKHYLGQEVVDDLPMSAVDFPLMIERNGTLMAIHAMGVHPDGSFDYIHDFKAGEQLRFGYCHTGLIAEGAKRLHDSLISSNAEAIFIYSCVSRKWILGKDTLIELGPLQKLASSSGAFCYGEYFGKPGHPPLFMSQTLTALCLSEAPAASRIKDPDEETPSFKNLESHQFRTMRVLHRLVETSTHEIDLMNEELSRLAQTDALTSLNNRRMFDIALSREIKRTGRNKSPLSLIMLDVDHFKLYNDTYGHVMGDDCLREISKILRNEARRYSDFPARYGGEEFALILPDTSHCFAMELAEAIRCNIEKLDIPHSSSPTSHQITASLGVITALCDKTSQPDVFISQADQQLYQAKQDGRNRVRGCNLSRQ